MSGLQGVNPLDSMETYTKRRRFDDLINYYLYLHTVIVSYLTCTLIGSELVVFLASYSLSLAEGP